LDLQLVKISCFTMTSTMPLGRGDGHVVSQGVESFRNKKWLRNDVERVIFVEQWWSWLLMAVKKCWCRRTQLAGPWLLSEGRKKVGGAFIVYQNLETPISRITCPQG
jgi:hypothetical protein